MKLWIVFFITAVGWSADLLIDIPVYAVGTIAGKEYAVSRTWLYRKSDIFRPVYQLPQPIYAARIVEKDIETPEYTVQIGTRVTVVKHKNNISAITTIVPVVWPVDQLTSGNTCIVAYDGLQLARKEGSYLRLLSLADISADQLEKLRLTFVSQNKNMTYADRQYVCFLYRLETEKRREGAHDAYPVTLP